MLLLVCLFWYRSVQVWKSGSKLTSLYQTRICAVRNCTKSQVVRVLCEPNQEGLRVNARWRGEVVSVCSLVWLIFLVLFLPKCSTVLSFSICNGSVFETWNKTHFFCPLPPSLKWATVKELSHKYTECIKGPKLSRGLTISNVVSKGNNNREETFQTHLKPDLFEFWNWSVLFCLLRFCRHLYSSYC